LKKKIFGRTFIHGKIFHILAKLSQFWQKNPLFLGYFIIEVSLSSGSIVITAR
jgi:hypothetical protein